MISGPASHVVLGMHARAQSASWRDFYFLFATRNTCFVFNRFDVDKVSVHGDDPSEVTPGQFRRFLVDSPLIRETTDGKIVRPRNSSTRRSALMNDDESKVGKVVSPWIAFPKRCGWGMQRILSRQFSGGTHDRGFFYCLPSAKNLQESD